MFANNLKIAWRHLLKHKYISAINLVGLVVGMTAVLFIWQYVAFEKSYDSFHEKGEHIYRIRTDRVDNGVPFMQFAAGAACAAPVISQNFSEVENYVKLYRSGEAMFKTDNNIQFLPEKVFYSMPSLFEIFSFNLIEGDPKTSLAEPFTACISKNTAKKMFGEIDPIGKTITRNNQDIYKITGIFAEPPLNSHLKFDILLSYVTFSEVFVDDGSSETAPYWDGFLSYLLLNENADVAALEAKIPEVMLKTYDQEAAETVVFALQPLLDIHLTSNFLFETEPPGEERSVNFLFFIGVFVLLIAWFNYINLSTARSELRAKEVGIRKVAGSGRKGLIFQFLTEAALMNLLAIFCAFSLTQLLSTWFVSLMGKEIPLSLLSNPTLLAGILLVFLLGTLLAGLYPAFVLSSFKPIAVLKTGFTNNQVGGGNWMRKGLVVFQFMASIGLIASTLVVFGQLKFMQNAKLGVDIEKTLVIERPIVRDSTFAMKAEAFKKELKQLANVKSISSSTSVPGQPFGWTAGITKWGDEDGDSYGLHGIAVDLNFSKSYQFEFAAGRPMDENRTMDTTVCILNEKAVEAMKLGTPEDALGVELNFWGDRVKVVGVTKNFHQESPKAVVEPMIMKALRNPGGARYFSLKLETDELNTSLASIESTWNNIFPGSPLDYFFLDDHFDQQYAADRLFGKIFTLFSGLAIFISCLGLFALVAFVAERKKKEIGIRKVLGATVPGIVGLISKEFIQLVILALIIAAPLAYFSMNSWLDNFANRIDISWWVFVVAGALAVVIAFTTVSFHSIKAALTNPIHSLRNE